jgi:hypothetical protein
MSYHLLSKSGQFESFTKSDSDSVFVKGFASVEIEDREGEIVDPLEFNVDTFVNTGTLLRDHKYISDPYGNHVSAGKVIAAEPAEIYKIEDGELSLKSIRTGDHITELLHDKHPELSVGDKGLFVVAEVINDLAKREVKNGILNAFSWKGWNYRVQDGKRIRLKSVDLSEISLVHQPVNNQSTYVRIADSDAKILAHKLNITKMKFRRAAYKSISDVEAYLEARHITPVEIKESKDGYIAVLEDVSKYEVAKSVCIATGDCDLIAAPRKDEDNFVATFVGEETDPSVGENEMSQSQDSTPERRAFKFCVVDEAVLQKLFPNCSRSEVVKGATIALEDGEVADVEILEASISDEEVSALLNPPQEPAQDPVQETETEVETPAAAVEQPANVHEDVVALFKAVAEQQAATQKMLADLLKEKDNKPAPKADDESAKVLAELKEAQKALAKLVPPQDDREERSVATKGSAPQEQSLGQMFSFLLS